VRQAHQGRQPARTEWDMGAQILRQHMQAVGFPSTQRLIAPYAKPRPHHQTQGRARLRQLRGAVCGWPGIEGFYWDDQANRRLRPESVVALMQAKAFARAMSGKDDAR
jgi:hypothetical protein